MEQRGQWLIGAKGVLVSLGLAVLCSLSTEADARKPVVSLGDVTTSVVRPRVNVADLFRREVTKQIAGMDWTAAHATEPYILSARLVQLDTETQGDRARSTCLVSTTLRKERSGALHASVQGKASSEDRRGLSDDNELEAMRAAVRSALRGLPSALR